ncbi:DUF2157 domain-containing protein [Granulibacter bethesdensis]|uniref:DUF2157 domain-containing protein n=2 Tax=Granulibacter bethesdensis TaxID=364410 RepID=Q0BV55_GRABC|nr:DUF2157 domain-containing protein [Granulibacter bethesdensis]ABI61297.1 Hypothetical protein GbCGDNIH1_0399 [Granulibacter bethesdensis CGDNIH1]AHJ62167.1 Hypothetical protein GbCGDNIH3_0399 [Granulibacter bethesdensis]AHJ67411.1 Hypothetical protein GbCGDNIH2_0399 [Granulibacter bethesdensis]APH51084.1 Hypothetical protein GbCGDNIH5_0399 [Granulibacter bethesdensis]APH58707.1 Hypothetical protein GbCGDNIH7_0399 [Granulibacter bethesdensis]
MKVVLDLDRLLREGQITPEERDRLIRLGKVQTGSLFVNVLVGFGSAAVCAGLFALAPDPLLGLLMGVVAIGAAVLLRHERAQQWGILSDIFALLGVLTTGMSLYWIGQGPSSMLLLALCCAGGALFARSAMLSVLAVLALAASLDTSFAYVHATYMLGVERPAQTILVFTGLGLALLFASTRVAPVLEGVVLAAARCSALMVNFAFWVGSLWGEDRMLFNDNRGVVLLSADIFSIGWALVLVAAAAWGAWSGRRWLITTAAIFGAIHFQTQWFERLGATPTSVLTAGILTLLLAALLWRVLYARKPSVPA